MLEKELVVLHLKASWRSCPGVRSGLGLWYSMQVMPFQSLALTTWTSKARKVRADARAAPVALTSLNLSTNLPNFSIISATKMMSILSEKLAASIVYTSRRRALATTLLSFRGI
ncbi:hypothetical protein EYF80_018367 [Liparis tanakae]|uniref:Uncharacterized protein n=1 Tax=Liparis tanakae TaxID=230148 RepID=A0A4Z2I0J8_9TELE|nr:hypothetical protein EYF80_018367 [Liparis tanakae]